MKMRLFTASNAAIVHNLVGIFLLLFLFLFLFPKSTLGLTTPYRPANIVETDGITPYTNLNNCTTTDGLTCDRIFAPRYANLYFRDFGTYADFGIPDGSTVTKATIRVTGKTSRAIHAAFFIKEPNRWSNCQSVSFSFWNLYNLVGDTINTHDIAANVVRRTARNVFYDYCLQPYFFESKQLTARINHSTIQNWSANIDNLEIALEYDPPPAPTPTATPTLIPSPTPTPTPSKTPLILIPGIGGSELQTADTVIWNADNGHGGIFTKVYPPKEKVWIESFTAALPGNDDYFDILKMFESGQEPMANLELTGTLFEGYSQTIDFFTSNDYTLNKDFFLFPYDWRKDISHTFALLDNKIQEIKNQTGSDQVNIISHSMGGLVARNYIANSQKAENVEKLFTLGTPHLGSVEFLKKLKFGGCLTLPKFETFPVCLGVSASETRDVLQNMISGYQLAPSKKYFDFYDLSPYKKDGKSLDYSGVKSLLTDEGYNTELFIPSEELHDMDNELQKTNGVDVVVIAGSGLATLGQIREYFDIDSDGNKTRKKDAFTINGDQTVPLFSASLEDLDRDKSLLGDAKIYYTKQEHGELVNSGPALNVVKNILQDKKDLPDGVFLNPYPFSGTQVSAHSPVTLDVYDENGNHTGASSDGDIETNIPGSSYDTLDDAKFVFVPNNGTYTIKLNATDQGSFDFKIKSYENDSLSKELVYSDIPLTTDTFAETQLDTLSLESPILSLDEDGDGEFDEEISEDSITPTSTPATIEAQNETETQNSTETQSSASSTTVTPATIEALSSSETLNSTASTEVLGIKTSSATVKPIEKNETNQAMSSEHEPEAISPLFQALSTLAGVIAIVYFKLNGELLFQRFFKMKK
jgi:pimeloyl-ACP methyl ester carboxylesterase